MALPSSQAKVTTNASHRPGGKFANLSSAGPRGKFANGPPRGKFMSPPSSSGGGGGGGGGEKNLSLLGGGGDNDNTNVSQKKKMIIPTLKPQPVFRDLEEAERLVLELMKLASHAATILKESCDYDHQDGSNKKGFREEELEKNGEEYLKKVKRIHDLLSPHADLVVAYRNHAIDTKPSSSSSSSLGDNNKSSIANNTKNKGVGNVGESKKSSTSSNSTDDKKTGTNIQSGNNKMGGGNDGEKSKNTSDQESELADILNDTNKNYNMYATRVEMRLAAERRDVLKLLLEQEKEMMGCDVDQNVDDEEGDASKKRKRDE